MTLTGNTVLITGGTSGIGRALAEAFHARGNTVVIAGRRQELLDEITAANPGMHGVVLDVEDPESIAAVAAQVRAEHSALNVLINNAGISRPESLTDGFDLAVSQSILQTNVVGVLQTTAALLPHLQAQPRAVLMATTSGLAFVPLATHPTYCASKAFVHSWLESLRAQLAGTSVEVLELAPPYVQTELGGPAQATDPAAMPLADYVAETMRLLEDDAPPRGEILVERVEGLRWAERDGRYQRVFAGMNGR